MGVHKSVIVNIVPLRVDVGFVAHTSGLVISIVKVGFSSNCWIFGNYVQFQLLSALHACKYQPVVYRLHVGWFYTLLIKIYFLLNKSMIEF